MKQYIDKTHQAHDVTMRLEPNTEQEQAAAEAVVRRSCRDADLILAMLGLET